MESVEIADAENTADNRRVFSFLWRHEMISVRNALEIAQAAAALAFGAAGCLVTLTPDGKHLHNSPLAFYLSYALIAGGGFIGSLSARLDYVKGLFFPSVGYFCCHFLISVVVTGTLFNQFWPIWLFFVAIPSLLATLPGVLAGVLAFNLIRAILDVQFPASATKACPPDEETPGVSH